MPTFLTITYDTLNVLIEFNDLETSPQVSRKDAFIARKDIISIQHFKYIEGLEYVEVDILQSKASWQLTASPQPYGIPVTSIQGVVPTSNEHLCSLVKLIKPQGVPL